MINGIGERIQELRKSRHLSQSELAHAIGVSPSIVSNYERSERTPSIEILMALASFFCCSTDYLLGMDNLKVSNIDASMLNKNQQILLQNFLMSFKDK